MEILRLLILIVLFATPCFAQDTTPPVGNIGINKDMKFVTNRFVTLTIESHDENGIKRMCISNIDTCPAWQAYERNIVWVLTAGSGVKTVHLWTEDMVGNVSHTTDYIRLEE